MIDILASLRPPVLTLPLFSTQVQWLHENRDEGCSSAAMDGAAEHNRLSTLEWLRQNRIEGE